MIRWSCILFFALSACGSSRDPHCPSSAPAEGATCDKAGTECEWGGDALGRNTTFGDCGQSQVNGPATWHVTSWSTPANPAACPATFAAAQSASCPSAAPLACDYDEGRCACLCNGTTPTWQCRSRSTIDAISQASAPSSSVCPTARPLIGTSCGAEGVECEYCQTCGAGDLSFGPCMTCSNGYWRESVMNAACTSSGCPGF
jgi:hypothetical protein